MSKLVDVKIHGHTFRLWTDAEPGYVRELESYVEGIIAELEELGRKSRVVDSHRIALMAALQIADDYLQLKRNTEGYTASVHEKVHALISASDRLLE